MIKKVIQQGRSDFDARSVLSVREHDKMARTPLVAFFNIPSMWKRACLLEANILLARLPSLDEPKNGSWNMDST
jgi:hypothetical protein